MTLRQLTYKIVKWPAKGTFRISRSSLNEFITVQIKISQDGFAGVAECRPYSRYNETANSVIAEIEAVRKVVERGVVPKDLLSIMPAGAARNAVDCALWDLKAKSFGRRIWDVLDIPVPKPRATAFTLSIDTPENIRKAANDAKRFSVLKIKTDRENGIESCQAVLSARPDAKLIIDANEAWDIDQIRTLSELHNAQNIALVEQPMPAGKDKNGLFATIEKLTICADESLHSSADLERIWKAGYRAVNVKLDKTGGLTEALTTMRKAKSMGFKVMAGCMVGSSLAMAPMAVLESFADYIDLDGPLLLNNDVDMPIRYEGELLHPPRAQLWG